MKNTRIYLAVMAVAMLFVASCQKESLVKQEFSARMEADASDAKTTLVGSNLQWQHGSDHVSITSIATTTNENNQSQVSYTTSTFTARTHSSNNPAYANLTLDDNQEELAEGSNVTYRAIYPAGAARDNNTKIILPRTQESTSGELTGYPMYAESDSKSIQFKNLCSVLKLSLTGTETISKIEVVTDQYINGTFTIGRNSDGTPSLTPDATTDHTKVTTLTMSTAVTLTSSAQFFFIYLPVQEYKYIKVNFYNQDNLVYSKDARTVDNSGNGVTFERSKYHLLAISTPAFEPSVLCGEFTVSTSGTKVSFSKGNLLLERHEYAEVTSTYSFTGLFGRTYSGEYISQKNTTEYYKFADNQYDRNEGTNPTYDKWLFEWGKSSSASTMFERWKNSQEITSTTVHYMPPHTENCTINHIAHLSGGGDINWRCLTQPEWDYLLTYSNQRMTYYNKNGVQQTNDINRCYALATVNNIHGMIIFPDVFYWPLDEKEADFGSNSSWSNTNNTYTLVQWRILEGAGCVFLPTTGYKTDSDDHTNTGDQNNYGAYWSRTKNLDMPRFLLFSDQTSAFADDNQGDEINNYNAIRLVKYLNN